MSFRTGLWSEEEPESRSDDRPPGDKCCCLGDLIPLLTGDTNGFVTMASVDTMRSNEE
jgi:hypothetical protein